MTRWQHSPDSEMQPKAKAAAEDSKASRTGILNWPLSAAIIGIMSVAAWLLIAWAVRWLLVAS